MPNDEYLRYRERQDAQIRDVLNDMEVQPVFFIGAGLSKRYFGAPNWIDLLRAVADRIGLAEEEFSYIYQKQGGDTIAIGSVLEDKAFEWAWGKGRNNFPKNLFSEESPKSSFLKYIVAEHVRSISPAASEFEKLDLYSEINLLRETNPHAIITTNYDGFLEELFEGYEAVIGEQVIRSNLNLIGEIFKIHGSMSDPNTLVITGDDYNEYREKKKYISAKLLTYLAEHPIFIFGYGFGDPNVTGIIQDVGRIIGGKDKFIGNIFYIKWEADASNKDNFQEEYIIGDGDLQFRVRAIIVDDLSWVFKSIAQEKEFKPINTKLLRALAARTYQLVRSDIPRRKVEVDYETLEAVADKSETLPKLLGIVAATNTNMSHPYVLTQVGRQLGFNGWHGARQLIERVAKETGNNITQSDNQYHCAVKSGDKSVTHKYSKEAVQLLKKVAGDQKYTVTP